MLNPQPSANLSPSDNNPCVTDAVVTLVGAPAGGTYSGTGVTGNTFNPATAGVGSHPVSYLYTDANGCSDTATITITVNGCAGVEDISGSAIEIYPNPADQFISVSFHVVETNNAWKLDVYTIEGKLLITKEILIGSTSHIENLNIGSLSSGTYVIRIMNKKGESITKRFIRK
jgi:hypothetical protein